jgi:hypothetical protein
MPAGCQNRALLIMSGIERGSGPRLDSLDRLVIRLDRSSVDCGCSAYSAGSWVS